jgi:5-oxoprolinase (ATP-hydrolysing) subunit A
VNQEKAILVVNAIQHVFENVKIYLPYNSIIEKVALEYGIEIVYEAFADRNYNDNLTLVSRSLPYAIITDKLKVLNHVKKILDDSKVRTVTFNEIEIKADTFCVHGDNKNTIEILQYLQENL